MVTEIRGLTQQHIVEERISELKDRSEENIQTISRGFKKRIKIIERVAKMILSVEYFEESSNTIINRSNK